MRLPHSRALRTPAGDRSAAMQGGRPLAMGWAARALAGALRLGRAPAVLAVGDTVDAQGVIGEGGRSRQALGRLSALNPRLGIVDACQPAAGLAEAAAAARETPRSGFRGFDLAVVFLGNAEVLRLASCCRYAPAASDALASLSRLARQVFVVTAFDTAQLARQEEGDITRPLQRRHQWLCRTLRNLCAEQGAELLDLTTMQAGEWGEVEAHRDSTQGPEAWTSRMLQRPALAHLVFG